MLYNTVNKASFAILPHQTSFLHSPGIVNPRSRINGQRESNVEKSFCTSEYLVLAPNVSAVYIVLRFSLMPDNFIQ